LSVIDGATEDFNGSNACQLMRGVVVEVGRMGKGHGPKGIVLNLRPTECGVDHHGAGFGDNNANAAFGNTVLPLSANATETNRLDIGGNFLDKLLTFEGSVVGVVRVNGDAMSEGHAFKAVFGTDSVRSVQGHLMFNVDETGGDITEDHGTTELVRLGLTTGSVEETPFYSRFKMVTENTATWEEHVSFEVANSVWVLGSGSGVVWGARLLSIFAGGADASASS
jgi:hypothetical protein